MKPAARTVLLPLAAALAACLLSVSAPALADGAEADVPSADKAAQVIQSLSDKGDVDELYMTASALAPKSKSLSASDRAAIGRVLLSQARSHASDAALSFGLSELSLRFAEGVEAHSQAAVAALALGELSIAYQHLDSAQKNAPTDDALKLKRAQVAAAAHDWEGAAKAYKSIPAKSPRYAEAQAGLTELAAEEKRADEAAAERAHRDLLRRVEAADDMIDAMPVSEFDLCRAHTLATCEAILACRKVQANCTFLLESCPHSTRPVEMKRPELARCAAALSALTCDKLEAAIPKVSQDVCRGLLMRTTKALVPEEGEPQKEKNGQGAEGKNTQDSQSQDGTQMPNRAAIEQMVRQIQQSGI